MTPTPLDLHVFARLAAGISANGRIAEVSEGLRPLAVHLDTLPLAERPVGLQSGVTALGLDHSALVQAIAAVDPLGPTPVDDASRENPPGFLDASAGTPINVGFARSVRSRNLSDATGRNPDSSPDEDELGIISGDAIRPEAIEWDWEGRLARGKFHLVAGPGSDGKTTLAMKFAAIYTQGAAWPVGPGMAPVGSVLILSAEDGREDTLVPRLIASGADMARVKFITCRERVKDRAGGYSVHPRSFQDLPYWRSVLTRISDARLMLVDPLPAYLGTGVNDHRNADVRAVMEPFCEMLNEARVTLIGITHTGKSADHKTPVNKVLGSVAYTNLARLVYVTVRDPDEDGRRYLAQPKNNLGPEQPALVYRIEPHEFEHDGEEIKTSRVVIDPEPKEIDAVAMLESTGKCGRRPSKLPAAIKWLRELLAAGPLSSDEIITKGDAAGFGRSLLFDAKKEAGIKARKVGFDGSWSWHLAPEGYGM